MNIQLNELRRLMAQIDSLVGSVEVTGSIREARQCAEKARSAMVKAVKIAAALDAQQLSPPPELPGEQELEAAGLGYPLSKEEAVKLWYSGFRSEVITVLEAWEAIGHDICMNPDKGELLDSLRNMAAICDAHGNDMPAAPAPELNYTHMSKRMLEELAKLGRCVVTTADLEQLTQERDEYEALCNRQAELLSQSIVAIRGPEPALTRYGYADLPLRVKTLVDERNAALAKAAELERKLDEEEGSHLETIKQRDNAEHWADQLANAIAERHDVDIGEHSNLNCPWNEALTWMQQPVAQADQLNALDKQCRDDVARALGLTPQGDGYAWSALLADIKTAAKVAQAGHAPEGYTLVPEHAGVDAIVTALYRRFKDWSARGFGPEDVTWCEVKADLLALVAQDGQVPQAWRDVQTERARQIASEGWTPEHDDEHGGGQMARAAACYALAGSCAPNDETAELLVSLAWPWAPEWWKPTTSRRDLVKAAALILAEMERLDRAAMPAQGGE
ncbi:hypothetical protein [Pseudomonas nitroreducens]|uniref:hypothetical protein n=1 Tax=Pseudomonas nitroreducens TaxID=46680 RepID=UPI0004679FD1|nr:hypothetical protein [Pseudomonas nitroreducens]